MDDPENLDDLLEMLPAHLRRRVVETLNSPEADDPYPPRPPPPVPPPPPPVLDWGPESRERAKEMFDRYPIREENWMSKLLAKRKRNC